MSVKRHIMLEIFNHLIPIAKPATKLLLLTLVAVFIHAQIF